MLARERASARRQLDKRLILLTNLDALVRPPRGWVKAIREALGMTASQLGQRMGVTKQRVLELEESEKRGAITLDSLERAANALDCRLVYALIPRMPLDDMVKERATRLARKQLRTTGHSMALEDQAVDSAEEEEQLKRLTESLIEKSGSALWKDE